MRIGQTHIGSHFCRADELSWHSGVLEENRCAGEVFGAFDDQCCITDVEVCWLYRGDGGSWVLEADIGFGKFGGVDDTDCANFDGCRICG